MSLRVISGSAKGRKLKQVPGDSTRPIMGRVKENLFNILGADVWETRWLDLFAGTGQVGIEALSRGASFVLFLDKVGPAIRTIEANVQTTRFTAVSQILKTDAFSFLEQSAAVPFDVIFIAPPQYQGMWLEALRLVDKRPFDLLTARGLVIVQIDPKEFEPPNLTHLELVDSRTYGNTRLDFYERTR